MSVGIDTEDADHASTQFAKHANGAAEIEKSMLKSLGEFQLPVAADGVTCAQYLQRLTEKISSFIKQCSDDTKAADNGGAPDPSTANALMADLELLVSSAPSVAHGTNPILVKYDDLLPDLKAGDYYKDRATDNDTTNDALWGADGTPSVDDVNQGSLGDCWLLSALVSMTATDPDRVKKLISDNGDGTYTVHLAAGDVNVDGSVLAVTNSGNAKWVAIVELAYAQTDGGSYDDLSGGYGSEAMKHIFGLDSDSFDPDKTWWFNNKDPDEAFDEIEAAINQGLPVTVSASSETGFGSNHILAVTGMTDVDGERCIEVRNPWGPSSSDGQRIFAEWVTKYGGSIDPNDPSVIRLPADVAAEIMYSADVAQ